LTKHFDLESGVRVMCDVGYLCANFSLSRPLYCRLRPDVRNRRQRDVRQTGDAHHRLMPRYGGGANKLCGRPPQYASPPASWPLKFWPWKWCPSHVWRGLPVCQF